MDEIIALKQQRFAGDPGKGVSEAIAEIEPGEMAPATAILTMGLARDARLLLGDRLDDHVRGAHQIIEAVTRHRASGAIDDDCRFEKARGGKPTRRGIIDQCTKGRGVRFIEEDRNQR